MVAARLKNAAFNDSSRKQLQYAATFSFIQKFNLYFLITLLRIEFFDF